MYSSGFLEFMGVLAVFKTDNTNFSLQRTVHKRGIYYRVSASTTSVLLDWYPKAGMTTHIIIQGTSLDLGFLYFWEFAFAFLTLSPHSYFGILRQRKGIIAQGFPSVFHRVLEALHMFHPNSMWYPITTRMKTKQDIAVALPDPYPSITHLRPSFSVLAETSKTAEDVFWLNVFSDCLRVIRTREKKNLHWVKIGIKLTDICW